MNRAGTLEEAGSGGGGLAPVHLAAAALLAPMLVSFVIFMYAGSIETNPGLNAVLARVQGLLSGSSYLLLFFWVMASRLESGVVVVSNRFSRYYFTLGIAGLLFFGFASPVISLAAGHTLKYTLGDTYRALLPFFAVIVLFSLLPLQVRFRRVLIRWFVAVAIAVSLIGAVWKLHSISSGVFYGGGLRQYYPGSLVLAVLLLRLLYGYYAGVRRFGWLLLVPAMMALSVLSLKRSLWIALALTVLLTILFSDRKARLAGLAVVGLLVVAAVGVQLGLLDLLVARFQYTYAGGAIDASTLERLAEPAGALFTLADLRSPLAYLVGFGSGAEFYSSPRVPMQDPFTGSAPGLYHHMHSTPFLLLFRYGLIGIALYAMLLVPLVQILAKLFGRRLRRFALRDFYGQILIAGVIEVGITLILGLQGNIIYGDPGFALLLFVIVGCYLELTSRHDSEPVVEHA